MKLEQRCCEKYRRKAKACKACPILAALGGKRRRRRLAKMRRKLAKAA